MLYFLNLRNTKVMKIVLASIFLGIGLGADSAQALDKDSFFYFLDAQSLGGYSHVSESDGNFSTLNNWSVSPNVILQKDKLYWINLYSGSYNQISRVTGQEEGGQSTESTQAHNLTTALKYNVTESWSLRPLFFTSWNFINETEDESFGNGLYDYRDIGGAIESTHLLEKGSARSSELIWGFRFYDRHYPNYSSLLSLFDPRVQVSEEHEKDFLGYKFNFGYESKQPTGWSWSLEEVLLYKDFEDKRTIDPNGIRSDNHRRQDYLNEINGSISHPLSERWVGRLDGQFGFNLSNLDFYDTHNTTTLADDTFVGDYFDYVSFLIRPSLNYEQPLANKNFVSATVSYGLTLQRYTGRKTQDSAGVYQDAEQQDFVHRFSGVLRYPLTPNISWVTQSSYTIADSNQQFETFYRYNYNSWDALTGVSIKY